MQKMKMLSLFLFFPFVAANATPLAIEDEKYGRDLRAKYSAVYEEISRKCQDQSKPFGLPPSAIPIVNGVLSFVINRYNTKIELRYKQDHIYNVFSTVSSCLITVFFNIKANNEWTKKTISCIKNPSGTDDEKYSVWNISMNAMIQQVLMFMGHYVSGFYADEN